MPVTVPSPPEEEPAATAGVASATDVTGTGLLLLTTDELPSGWASQDIKRFVTRESDVEIAQMCPSATLLSPDHAPEWKSTATNEVGDQLTQLIHEAADADQAAVLVAQFGEVAKCDLAAIFGGATGHGGAVSVDGSDAASTLYIGPTEPASDHLEIVAVAVGPIVSLVILEETGDSGVSPLSVFDISALVVAKIKGEI
jgi:hypothetical protein